MTTKQTAVVAATTASATAKPDLEVMINKWATKLAGKKHIDALDVALNYIFPILLKMAKESSEQANDIQGLSDEIAELAEHGGDTDTLIDAFESARDMLIKISGILDQTMVAAGFYSVTSAGLVATDKIPADLRAVYESLGKDANQTSADITEAIEMLEAEAEEEDEDDEDGSDGDDGEPAALPTEEVVAAPGVVTNVDDNTLVPGIADAKDVTNAA
jgi:hypothetical protein